MPEQLQPSHETGEHLPSNEWKPINSIGLNNYWFGADLNVYRNRLEANVPAIDDICRFIHLPPVNLRSGEWDPQALNYPDNNGFQTAVLKKLPFLSHVGSTKYPDYEVAPSELQAMTMPIGWDIFIQDQQIDHEIDIQNRNLTNSGKEKLYINKLNDTFWKGIGTVSRFEDEDKRNIFIHQMWQKYIGQISIIGGGAALGGVLSVLDDLSFQILDNIAKDIGVVTTSAVLAQIGDELTHTKSYKDNPIDNFNGYYSDGSNALFISNLWRESIFPEQFQKEKHGPQPIPKLLLNSIPLSLLMKKRYRYAFLKAQNRQKPKELFRLRDR